MIDLSYWQFAVVVLAAWFAGLATAMGIGMWLKQGGAAE